MNIIDDEPISGQVAERKQQKIKVMDLNSPTKGIIAAQSPGMMQKKL